jgi:capsular polysaccharide biosynthesis protein
VGRLLLRRIWLLVGLAAVAGLAAFFTTRGGEVVYERTTVFVLRPSALIQDAQIPDALRGIAQQDSQLIQTVARVIETDRFLRQSFRGVDTDAALVEGIDPRYEIQSGIRPGSDVIEVAVRGPDQDVLDELAANFADDAADWVSNVYRAYTLELLEISASDGPVSTDPTQLVVLAALLGLLIGAGVVAAEHKSRQQRAVAQPQLGLPTAEPVTPTHVRTRLPEAVTPTAREVPAPAVSGQRPGRRQRRSSS